MSRVLIVDDDPVIRRLLQVNFRLEGFDVETAGGGEEALATMQATRPDAVVLDITMPEVDGFEVCRRMRATDGFSDLAVVIVSARVREEDRREAERAGAIGYLTKPFDPADLVRLIHQVIHPGSGEVGAAS